MWCLLRLPNQLFFEPKWWHRNHFCSPLNYTENGMYISWSKIVCHNMGSLCPITYYKKWNLLSSRIDCKYQIPSFLSSRSIEIDRDWLFWTTDKSRLSRIVIISCPPNLVILWLLRALSSNPHYIVLFPVLLHTSVFFALHLLTVIVRVYFIRIGKKFSNSLFRTKLLQWFLQLTVP